MRARVLRGEVTTHMGSTSEILQYEQLVEAYEDSLLTKLRGHRAGAAFLEMWVPDEDPVKSILNMFEAAEAARQSEVSVRVLHTTLPPARHAELRAAAVGLGHVEVESVTGSSILRWKDNHAS